MHEMLTNHLKVSIFNLDQLFLHIFKHVHPFKVALHILKCY